MDFRTGKNYNIPLVTIGVLSYNYSKYLKEALDSLLTQTYLYIELIIVDDFSTECSPEIIKEWIASNNIQCTFIQNKKNRGIPAVSNMLVKKSTGKYINLFATDDIMLPEKIERQVKLLEEAGEEYGLCYANVLLIDEEGNYIRKFWNTVKGYEGDVLRHYVYGDLSYATPSTLIRRSVYDKVGYYNERVLLEDYNFQVRLMACYKVKYCEYPCIKYRWKLKSGSKIWEQLYDNKSERYYNDRILSNYQALKFIRDREIKEYLQKKITQYLKALTSLKSKYSRGVIIYLFRKGYFKIPVKVLIRGVIQ
jgi:glycosyltransferase involved in cell wall biosynthesis